MTHVTCRLTAKNRDQLGSPALGNPVWASFCLLPRPTTNAINKLLFQPIVLNWRHEQIICVCDAPSECVTHEPITTLHPNGTAMDWPLDRMTKNNFKWPYCINVGRTSLRSASIRQL